MRKFFSLLIWISLPGFCMAHARIQADVSIIAVMPRPAPAVGNPVKLLSLPANAAASVNIRLEQTIQYAVEASSCIMKMMILLVRAY